LIDEIFFFKKKKETIPEGKNLGVQYILLSSSISKMCAGIITYPHEVI